MAAVCGKPFFVAVLGHDDQRVDRLTLEPGVVGKQGIDRLDAQIRGFLCNILARQECRADLANDELFILGEFCTLGVVVQPFCRHVAGDAFYANHCGFPIQNSWRTPLKILQGR
jgi:hypothetical protein